MRISRSSNALRSTLWVALSIALACASTPPDDEVPSAEGYYKRAMEVLDGQRVMLFFWDVDYPRAIELFQEVIDNYPYSEYATLAELQIADVYFQTQKYEEAASYYQDFVELHPKHERVPYAIYRNGLCSFAQMRLPDQDQAPTREAIAHFGVLLSRYPESADAEAARQQLQIAEDQLARHDIEVADFYFGREDYYAAEERYTAALQQFPDHTDRLYTLSRLADSLIELHRFGEAREVLLRLVGSSSDEDLRDSAAERLEALDAEARAAGRVPAGPSCDGYLDPGCAAPVRTRAEIPCNGLLEPGCRPDEENPELRLDGNLPPGGRL